MDDDYSAKDFVWSVSDLLTESDGVSQDIEIHREKPGCLELVFWLFLPVLWEVFKHG